MFEASLRLNALTRSLIHHSLPSLRVRLGRKNVAMARIMRAVANVVVTVVLVTAQVQAPCAEVGAASQPWDVASCRKATALQMEG